MDKLSNKQVLLERIRLSEGPEFVFDETAILKAYAKEIDNKSSIPIKVLSIVGGILASLAFLAFLAIAGFYGSEEIFVPLGLGFIILAIVLNKVYDKLIIDTFSISIYLIGIALYAFGSIETDMDKNVVTLFVAFIALCTLFITRKYILSFISILIIGGSFLVLIISNETYNLIHVYVSVNTLLLSLLFLKEVKIISASRKLSNLYNPVRIGLIFSLIFGLIAIGKKGIMPIDQNNVWISSIAMILVISYLVYHITIITHIKSTKSRMLIYSLSLLFLIPTFFSPSISGSIVIILLSFLVNYKTGFAIGLIAFVYFISQYYYDLNFTLLTKSILLISSGIIFLLFYIFTFKKSIGNEKI